MCLYLSLLATADSVGLGDTLFIHLDNTCGENMCRAVFGVLALFVKRGYFRKTIVFTCPKGHTFTLLDQSFSKLIRFVFSKAIYSVSELVKAMYSAMVGDPLYNFKEAKEIHGLFDWNFVLQHMHPMSGFATGTQGTGMHLVIIEPDADGEPCIHWAHSSQSSTYIPEGRDGHRVFKTPPPDGPPPAAALKPDEAWSKVQVVATIRRWYSYFQHPSSIEIEATRKVRLATHICHSTTHMSSCLQEWEDRFNAPSAARPPAWRELPTHHVVNPSPPYLTLPLHTRLPTTLLHHPTLISMPPITLNPPQPVHHFHTGLSPVHQPQPLPTSVPKRCSCASISSIS